MNKNRLKNLLTKTALLGTIASSAYGVAIMRSENDVMMGYNKVKDEWCPHESVEGGTKTIAYGHKLSKNDNPNKCITNDEALSLFEQDLMLHTQQAMFQVNKLKPYGMVWESFSQGEQQILASIMFNVGTLKNKDGGFGWMKLVKAMRDNNVPRIKREMLTFTGGKPLTRKRDLVWEAVKDKI